MGRQQAVCINGCSVPALINAPARLAVAVAGDLQLLRGPCLHMLTEGGAERRDFPAYLDTDRQISRRFSRVCRRLADGHRGFTGVTERQHPAVIHRHHPAVGSGEAHRTAVAPAHHQGAGGVAVSHGNWLCCQCASCIFIYRHRPGADRRQVITRCLLHPANVNFS